MTDVNPLMRVSPKYTVSGGTLTAVSETVSEWGTLAVLINGEDITMFRGVHIGVSNLSWNRLGHYETAAFTIPTITVLERHGTGDLDWLTDSGTVTVQRVAPNGTRTTIWLGTINAIQPGPDGVGIDVTAHGLLYDASYRVAVGPAASELGEVVQDVGTDIVATMNKYRAGWDTMSSTITGVQAAREPAFETVLDYLKSLLALAVTDAGNSWTIWLNGTQPSLRQMANIPGAKTVTYTAGSDGVDDQLAVDTLAGFTTIYGQGVSEAGAAWRNTKFPAATSSAPRFPLDDVSEAFTTGATNASTVTGTGVTAVQNRLNTLIDAGLTVDGIFTEEVAAAVTTFQAADNITETGAVDLLTWIALHGNINTAAGAYIAPLATHPNVSPRLYDTNGADIGENPNYNPAMRPRETFVDFGDGVNITAARRAAQAVINRDSQQPVEGSLALTVCPEETARWNIRPGDRITLQNHWAEDLDLLVHQVEWQLGDTPTVTVTVSTRDMEYTELDAAINRLRTNRKPVVEAPKSTAAGIATVGLPSVLPGGVVGGGGDGTGSVPGPTIRGFYEIDDNYVLQSERSDYMGIIKGQTDDQGTPDDITIDLQEIYLSPGSGGTEYVGQQFHFLLEGNRVARFYAGDTPILTYNGFVLAGVGASCTLIRCPDYWLIVGAMIPAADTLVNPL
jgi:peptidoglycan hydrolase-like protein with peptidoglycan-binding domain